VINFSSGGIELKALNRAIDRFCHKHRKFGVPRLMLYIVIVSAIVFLIGGQRLIALMSFHPELVLRGELWRLVTWIFIPLNSDLLFTVIALYFYYFVGSSLESEWGTAKFTVFYIFGIVINIIYGFVGWMAFGVAPYLVPNYLNLSMFFAFAALFPDHVVRLFFIIPIKVKWLALVNAAFFAYSIISEILVGQLVMALLPLVALLNFFVLCSEDLLAHLRPLRARSSVSTINFKRAAKKAKREFNDKPYRHKCAVCGRTDADFPNLEFRYCSRCNGYHCFCIDHINNHIHFQ